LNTSTNKTFTKNVKSWIAYDVGNSAFATTVVAGFFPVFYLQYWAIDSGIDMAQATVYKSWALALCNTLVLFTAPLIGAITDINNSTKKSLVFFTVVAAFFVSLLSTLNSGSWIYALAFFCIANYCFSVAQIPYDKILTKITSEDKLSIVSNQGYAWGYLGGGFLFLVNASMFLFWEKIGLNSSEDAIKISFLMVSIWWCIFTLPIQKNFLEKVKPYKKTLLVRDAFKNIVHTIKSISRYKNASIFLLAFFLYIDGAHTVIYLAADFALNVNLKATDVIPALILVQFVAFPATLLWGFIADKYGDKLVLYITIVSYIFIIGFSTTLSSALEFYIMAAMVGSVQGGIQGSSRGLFGKLIPEEKAGEFFGLYNVLGRAGAIFGPLIVGTLLTIYGDVRIALFPLIILFILGGLLLMKVKVNNETF
jgi:UMF1 family MFS transporter|tara:strand:+ start:109 stop:1377 length:1269 start_codon:yes stop_codon:yes gene_type:complete